jgi:hypothetical protein
LVTLIVATGPPEKFRISDFGFRILDLSTELRGWVRLHHAWQTIGKDTAMRAFDLPTRRRLGRSR